MYLCAGLLFSGLCVTHAQVTIDGEFRPRSEFRQGFQKPLADSLKSAFVTLQRTRLTADYKTKILNARLTIQDSRIWGKSDTKSSDSKMEIYEAWAEYLITSGVSVQFGRQALKYDDQRIFSSANWSNTGLAHDLFLFKFKAPSTLQFHLGFAYNNTKDTTLDYNYTTKNMYKTMGFLWGSKTFENGITASIMTILEGLQKTNDNTIVYPRATYGGNFLFANDSSRFGLSLCGYLQSGKSSASDTFKNLNAYMFAAKASYKIIDDYAIVAGIDYYSGSSPSIAKGKSTKFNKLYGANHSFNGYMEYWTTLPKCGLIDYYGGVTAKVNSKISGELTGHLFNFAEKYVVKGKEINKNQGTELDFTLNYNVSKEIAIQAGYSHYFLSSAAKDYFKIANVDVHSPGWAYLMLTVKPNFYKTPPPVDTK